MNTTHLNIHGQIPAEADVGPFPENCLHPESEEPPKQEPTKGSVSPGETHLGGDVEVAHIGLSGFFDTNSITGGQGNTLHVVSKGYETKIVPLIVLAAKRHANECNNESCKRVQRLLLAHAPQLQHRGLLQPTSCAMQVLPDALLVAILKNLGQPTTRIRIGFCESILGVCKGIDYFVRP